jgi:hypothetical protein
MSAIACPVCEKLNDCHTPADADSAEPIDGDLSVCAGCLSFLVFTDGVTAQRCLTAIDLAKLEPAVQTHLMHVRSALRRWKPRDELQGATPP